MGNAINAVELVILLEIAHLGTGTQVMFVTIAGAEVILEENA